MKKHLIIPLIAAVAFIADVVSKRWALANLHASVVKPFIPGVLGLTLTTNTGGAFGIAQDHRLLMTVLPIGICVAIVSWIVQCARRGVPLAGCERVGYALVLGGALGNVFERLLRGHVTDFLDFAFMNFPIFNVADSLIDIGVGLVVLHIMLAKPAVQPDLSAASPSGQPDEPDSSRAAGPVDKDSGGA